MRRCLIIHPGTLGDIILSLPAIREIKNSENLLIHLCSRLEVASLLKAVGLIEEASDIDSAFYNSLFIDEPSTGVKTLLRSFDRLYLFTVNPTGLLSQKLSSLHEKVRVIHTIPKVRVHVADYRLRQVNPAKEKAKAVKLPAPSESLQKLLNILNNQQSLTTERLLTIHPGSGSKCKNIHLEVFIDLASHTLKKGFSVIFLTGVAEDDDTIKGIKGFVSTHENTIHLHNLSLIDVASVLSLSSLYIGNDSGISHLASVFSENLIVLFKSTDPVLWAPVSNHLCIVASDHRTKAFSCIEGFLLLSNPQ